MPKIIKPSDLAKGRNPASKAASEYRLFTSKNRDKVTNNALKGSVKEDIILSKNTGLKSVINKAINANLGAIFWEIRYAKKALNKRQIMLKTTAPSIPN